MYHLYKKTISYLVRRYGVLFLCELMQFAVLYSLRQEICH